MYMCLCKDHSEFGITGNASLKNWDVNADLKRLTVPTLIIGAKYDTMDPEHMKWIANEVQNGRFFFALTEATFRNTMILKPIFQA